MANLIENINLIADYIRGENQNIYVDIEASVKMSRDFANAEPGVFPDPENYPLDQSARAFALSIKTMTTQADALDEGENPTAVWTPGIGTNPGDMAFGLPKGTPGEKWWITWGNPASNIGVVGDLALDRLSNNIFEKTGFFTWSFSGNIKGDTGMGIQPQGEATVAEINALDPASISGGDVWVMLDSGILNDGPDGGTLLVTTNDWIGWGDADSNWMNLGEMQGPQGERGPQGDTANVIAGTTTTLSPGVDATVSSVTTDNDVTLNFGIPEGIQGIQGVIGNTGDTGSQGISATCDVDENVIKIAAGGVPTVVNVGTTQDAEFQFGVVTGDKGDLGNDGPQGIPGMGIYPMGEATVAELNALIDDPAAGATWVMLDAGTVTYGSQPVDVIIDDWMGWGDEGYFVNLGPIQGPAGEDGEDGIDGINPVVQIGSVVGVPAGTSPTVTDGDPDANRLLLNFQLEQGEDGTPGTNGIDGIDGISPPAPLAPTVVVGTTNTNPPGTESTVTDGDTGSNVVLNFTLEKGETGSIGPTGPAGPNAVSGDAGNLADIGLDGLILVDRALPLLGGTMTGQAKGITPVAPEDLTRKDYVDTKLPLNGSVAMTGNLEIVNGSPAITLEDTDSSYQVNFQVDGTGGRIEDRTVGSEGYILGWDSSKQVTFTSAMPLAGMNQGTAINELTRKDYVDGLNATQDAAIALNTAKVSYKDTMTFDGTTLAITIG